MSLIARARADVLKITTDLSGFGVPITIESPDGLIAIVAGTAKKHHLRFDDMGNAVNIKTATCSIAEAMFVSVDYPVRNERGEVFLKGHKVSWTDSSGALCQYIINENHADETVGLIVCILGDFN